jgi:hypothetical protein
MDYVEITLVTSPFTGLCKNGGELSDSIKEDNAE